MLRSLPTEPEARQVIFGTRDTVKQGGFNLTKFVVNSETLTNEIEESHRASEAKEFSSQIVSKALGIKWNVTDDDMLYVSRPVADLTKVSMSSVLSQVSSMYDPWGLISPIILRGKIIFRSVVQLKLSWKEPVPSDVADRWYVWLDSLKGLSALRFSRCIMPTEFLTVQQSLFIFVTPVNRHTEPVLTSELLTSPVRYLCHSS